jgi:hypothetical protein
MELHPASPPRCQHRGRRCEDCATNEVICLDCGMVVETLLEPEAEPEAPPPTYSASVAAAAAPPLPHVGETPRGLLAQMADLCALYHVDGPRTWQRCDSTYRRLRQPILESRLFLFSSAVTPELLAHFAAYRVVSEHRGNRGSLADFCDRTGVPFARMRELELAFDDWDGAAGRLPLAGPSDHVSHVCGMLGLGRRAAARAFRQLTELEASGSVDVAAKNFNLAAAQVFLNLSQDFAAAGLVAPPGERLSVSAFARRTGGCRNSIARAVWYLRRVAAAREATVAAG